MGDTATQPSLRAAIAALFFMGAGVCLVLGFRRAASSLLVSGVGSIIFFPIVGAVIAQTQTTIAHSPPWVGAVALAIMLTLLPLVLVLLILVAGFGAIGVLSAIATPFIGPRAASDMAGKLATAYVGFLLGLFRRLEKK